MRATPWRSAHRALAHAVPTYWEPAAAGPDAALFAQLRAEVDDLAARTADQRVDIAAVSYRELWHGRVQPQAPDWLRRIAALLQTRYGITLAPAGAAAP